MAENETMMDAPPPIDGPGGEVKIKASPPVTARLSKNGKGLLAGGVLVVVAGMLIGIMTAGGGSEQKPATEVDAAATAADSVGQEAGPQGPTPEQRAQVGGGLTTREDANAGAGGAEGGGAQGQGHGNGNKAQAPTPAEAHRLWLEKHRYERLQGRIMAAEAAETADFGKTAGLLAAAGSRPGGKAGVEEPAEDRRVAEARRRALEAVAANPQAAQDPSIQALLKSLAAAPPGGTGAGNGDPAERAQTKNKLFLADAEAKNPIYLDERVQPRLGEHELVAGSVIPAVLLSAINSDLPGSISAQVRQTVYDTHNPGVVVIPQGSRLVGRYSSDVAYGQKRVLVAWDSLIFPNGNSINLRGMVGADGQGRSGLSDQIDNHFWRIWGSALMTSLLGVGVQLAQPQNVGSQNTPTAQQSAAAAVANSLNETGTQILRKNMNIQPTLEIRPGYTFHVMVNKTLILPAFRTAAW